MENKFRILTNNYSGYSGNIIYYPSTGGTINLGSHILPFDYIADYYYGNYVIYIPDTGVTCYLELPPTPTQTPTYTPTPTLTPTHTPTNTVTPTNTPTVTPTCNCTYIDVTISSQDLFNAVGNTTNPSLNGVVLVKYTNCGGGTRSKQYTTAGTYLNDICSTSDSDGSPSYYKNNIQRTAISTSLNNGHCCVPITPTPTPTMTPEECSIVLNEIIFISGTTWGYVFTNTVSSCDQLHLSYSLDNINWDAISTYDCVTVPALYDIGVVADIIYFRMTQECGGIPVTSNTIIISNVTPTPTMTLTPTPTPTQTLPIGCLDSGMSGYSFSDTVCPTLTNTPTQTPTQTLTPTPTPTCLACQDNNSRLHYDSGVGSLTSSITLVGSSTYTFTLVSGQQGISVPPGTYDISVVAENSFNSPDVTIGLVAGDTCVGIKSSCYKMGLGTFTFTFNNFKIGCLHQQAVTGTYTPGNPNYQYFADLRIVIGVVPGNNCLPIPTNTPTPTLTQTNTPTPIP